MTKTMKIRCRWFITAAVIFLFPLSTGAAGPLTIEESISLALKNSLAINIAKEGAKGAEARKREAFTGFLPIFAGGGILANYQASELARERRPELKIYALKASQAGKMVRVAQSEYYPSVSLVGNYGRFGDTPSVYGTQYQDQESWHVMAVATWNFWEWGKTKYRVDAGKALENQAIDQSQDLHDQIALEIKNAYLTLREAESQIAVSQKVIEQAEENFRISEARYKERVAAPRKCWMRRRC